MGNFSKLEKALKEFRANRKGRQAIPEEIWRMVRDLPSSYKINHIAKPLGLNWAKVKDIRTHISEEISEEVSFIEVKQKLPGITTGNLTIKNQDGSILEIPSSMLSESFLAAVVKSFIGGSSL